MSEPLRLRRKFIAVAMVSVSIVMLVILIIMNYANYSNVVRKADQTLEMLMENDGKFPQPDNMPMGVFPENDKHADFSQQSNGRKVLQEMSPETPFETRFFSVTFDADGQPANPETSSIAAVDAEKALEYASDIKKSNSAMGFVGNYRYHYNGEIVVFLDCTRDLETFWSFLGTSAIVAAAGLACVFLLAFFLSKVAVKPIEQSYEKQKRFITDASHEIRTPLTIIDANVEVMEMTGGENDWTRSTRSQISRLTELTSSLVALSRMDEGQNRLQMADFSISDAVSETASNFESLALTTRKKYQASIEKNISFFGDEQKIRQLVSILMDNSIKYSDPYGWISLSLKKSGKKICLDVSNSVEKIVKGHHDQVFDRFSRMDSSRGSAVPGYGLGLSMAQAIVQTHKGKISAFSPDEKTFSISVQL